MATSNFRSSSQRVPSTAPYRSRSEIFGSDFDIGLKNKPVLGAERFVSRGEPDYEFQKHQLSPELMQHSFKTTYQSTVSRPDLPPPNPRGINVLHGALNTVTKNNEHIMNYAKAKVEAAEIELEQRREDLQRLQRTAELRSQTQKRVSGDFNPRTAGVTMATIGYHGSLPHMQPGGGELKPSERATTVNEDSRRGLGLQPAMTMRRGQQPQEEVLANGGTAATRRRTAGTTRDNHNNSWFNMHSTLGVGGQLPPNFAQMVEQKREEIRAESALFKFPPAEEPIIGAELLASKFSSTARTNTTGMAGLKNKPSKSMYQREICCGGATSPERIIALNRSLTKDQNDAMSNESAQPVCSEITFETRNAAYVTEANKIGNNPNVPKPLTKIVPLAPSDWNAKKRAQIRFKPKLNAVGDGCFEVQNFAERAPPPFSALSADIQRDIMERCSRGALRGVDSSQSHFNPYEPAASDIDPDAAAYRAVASRALASRRSAVPAYENRDYSKLQSATPPTQAELRQQSLRPVSEMIGHHTADATKHAFTPRRQWQLLESNKMGADKVTEPHFIYTKQGMKIVGVNH